MLRSLVSYMVSNVRGAAGAHQRIPPCRWVQFIPRYSLYLESQLGTGNTSSPDNSADGLCGFPLRLAVLDAQGSGHELRVYDRQPVSLPTNTGVEVLSVNTPPTGELFRYDVIYGESIEDQPPERTGPGGAPVEGDLAVEHNVTAANSGVNLLAKNPRREEAILFNNGPDPVLLGFGSLYSNASPEVIAAVGILLYPQEKYITATKGQVYATSTGALQVSPANVKVFETFIGDF